MQSHDKFTPTYSAQRPWIPSTFLVNPNWAAPAQYLFSGASMASARQTNLDAWFVQPDDNPAVTDYEFFDWQGQTKW